MKVLELINILEQYEDDLEVEFHIPEIFDENDTNVGDFLVPLKGVELEPATRAHEQDKVRIY